MQALDTDAPHKYKMLSTPSAKDRSNSASAGKEDSQHARRESRGDALAKNREDTKEKETQAMLKSKIAALTVDQVRARVRCRLVKSRRDAAGPHFAHLF